MSQQNSLVKFIAEHKAAVAIASAVVIAGTSAGIYYMSENQKIAAKKQAKKEKKKASKKSKKTTEGADAADQATTVESATSTPATDSASAPAAAAASSPVSGKSLHGFAVKKDAETKLEYPELDDFEKVQNLPENQRKELAAAFKAVGNTYFQQKKYASAIGFYDSALKCDQDAIFYSNRSACFYALKDWEKVIEDTTTAIELNPLYSKCFRRRATTHEQLNQLNDAILDYTIVCVLEKFADRTVNQNVERLIQIKAAQDTKEIYETRAKVLPSLQFLKAFMTSFRKLALPEAITTAAEDSGDYKLKLAFAALEKETYECYREADRLFSEAVSEEFISSTSELALAYEYVASFAFLKNDIEGATVNLDKSIELKPSVQAYIKRAALSLDSGNVAAAKIDFENAAKLNPESPDIYHHRGQMLFLEEKYDEALVSYKKSVALDSDFIASNLFIANTLFKKQDITGATAAFNDCIKQFPNRPEPYTYFAECLMSTNNFDDALKMLDKAIEIAQGPNNATSIDILPMVNKAVILFQAKGDVAGAIELCEKALVLDPHSDITIATLSQLYLAQKNHAQALKYMDMHVQIARSEQELAQTLAFKNATEAQVRLESEYPAVYDILNTIDPSTLSAGY
ncbi:TPR-like protein [Nadsonia fulvescens var. elongata DSM 6958]|uniref:TPR-like protein n=1 Tax=Nadsonia fulvescens var. elongata DSM 6958 TaxID=857566 RepID=A0A1E3PF25_9ASCO|nr:TPR-like protein [Nadsonia fulvescens var. elongata DSM 6958]